MSLGADHDLKAQEDQLPLFRLLFERFVHGDEAGFGGFEGLATHHQGSKQSGKVFAMMEEGFAVLRGFANVEVLTG